MKRIAQLLSVESESHPRVDFENTHIDWDKIHEGDSLPFTHNGSPVDDDINTQRFAVTHPDKYSWDFYSNPGHYGFVSKRLRDAIQPHCDQCFDFWPVMLDDVEFFIIRRIGVINCLDRASSEVRTFPGKDKIMGIDRYAFHKEMIPDICMFSIPEMRNPIFFTNGLTRLVLPMQLKGMMFTNAESIQGDLKRKKWNPTW